VFDIETVVNNPTQRI